VGEVEALPDSVCPSRALRDTVVGGRRFRRPEPSWDCPAFRSVASPVAAIWFTAPVPPCRRPHGLPGFAIRRRSAGSSRRRGVPFRAYHDDPAGTLRGSGNPHGVFFPYSDIRAEVHQPGFPHPVRSAFRVSHPPDGLLPPAPSGLEDRCHSWGSSLQSVSPPQSLAPKRLSCPHVVSDIACSCSEDQEVTMPRNSRALLPAEIRTRLEPMRARADTLMGFRTLRQQHLPLRAPVARRPPGTHPDGEAREGSTHRWIAKPARASRSATRPGQREEVRIPWVRPATEERPPGPVPGFSRRVSVLSDCSDFK
jgi:hypothetical protein